MSLAYTQRQDSSIPWYHRFSFMPQRVQVSSFTLLLEGSLLLVIWLPQCLLIHGHSLLVFMTKIPSIHSWSHFKLPVNQIFLSLQVPSCPSLLMVNFCSVATLLSLENGFSLTSNSIGSFPSLFLDQRLDIYHSTNKYVC